jgi:hypothetical protein
LVLITGSFFSLILSSIYGKASGQIPDALRIHFLCTEQRIFYEIRLAPGLPFSTKNEAGVEIGLVDVVTDSTTR